MRNAIAVAALLCMTSAVAAGNSMYRWVDKDGNVHYGDQAPSGSPSKLVKPDVDTTPAPSDEELAAAKARADKCKTLQNQLASYSKAGKISETDALGNVHEYSEDEKKKLVQQVQSRVDEACGPATTTAATP